jgi:hypothetical protein
MKMLLSGILTIALLVGAAATISAPSESASDTNSIKLMSDGKPPM